MSANLKDLSKLLGDALNEAIRASDAVSDAVAEIQASGHDISELTLSMSVGRTALNFPVAIEPSVAWLDRLMTLTDRRQQ